MLRVVLRDTLNHQGIPTAWVAGEVLLENSRSQRQGVHLRLVVKHWNPRLLTHGVALQNALIKRVTAFDPMAGEWLMGISWQFALADESQCPSLPHPGSWTAAPSDAPADAATSADLEKLLAVRNADFRQHPGEANAPRHDETQPMFLQTQPMQL